MNLYTSLFVVFLCIAFISGFNLLCSPITLRFRQSNLINVHFLILLLQGYMLPAPVRAVRHADDDVSVDLTDDGKNLNPVGLQRRHADDDVSVDLTDDGKNLNPVGLQRRHADDDVSVDLTDDGKNLNPVGLQ